MENEIQIFEHEQFGKIRVVVINGKVCFVAADVCRALEIGNTSQALTRLDNDEKMTVILNEGQTNGVTSTIILNEGITGAVSGGWIKNEVNIVNEPGFYRLIFASRKPEALKFQRWVYHEVLPQIRKTGSYSLPNVEKAVEVQNPLPKYHEILEDIAQSAAALNKYWGVNYGIGSATMTSVFEENHNINLTRIKNLLPPAEHEIGYMNATQLAKKVGLKSAQAVNKILLEKGFQEKDDNGGYKLTEKGKKYGEAMPYEKNGHTGYQIKWSTEILSFLQ